MDAPLVLIVGTNRLGAAIAQLLLAAGAAVRTVTASGEEPAGLAAALLDSASAVVFTADDDAGNVDLALRARRLRPGVPLVIRVFDPQLAAYVNRTIEGAVVLSMSSLAAPVFVAHTRRAIAEAATHRPPTTRRERGAPAASLRRQLDRVVLGPIVGLAAVVALSTVFFARVLHLRAIDSLYFVWTTVMTVGYGDITLKDAPDGAKLVGMGLMLAGAAFMAVLFAFFTGWVVTRRLEVREGRVRVGWTGHIIIAGGGNVGTRVAQELASAGYRLVVIDRAADGRHVPALRMAGHHVIVADASSGDTLELAGITRAAAVVALTASDATNLHVALLARAHGGALPIVMRAQSSELSAHVTGRKDAIALSSLEVAAQAFAQAALGAARP